MDQYFNLKLQQELKTYTDEIQKTTSNNRWFAWTQTKIMRYIILAIGAAWAVYLSWRCSGYKGSMMVNRVISATLAGLLNYLYVAYYYLTKSDLCFIIKRLSMVKVTAK